MYFRERCRWFRRIPISKKHKVKSLVLFLLLKDKIFYITIDKIYYAVYNLYVKNCKGTDDAIIA